METFNNWLQRVFENDDSTTSAHISSPYDDIDGNPNVVFMIVPLKSDEIEVPVFMVNKFDLLVERTGIDKCPEYMVAELRYGHREPDYKTFDKRIKIVLTDSFKSNKLFTLRGKAGSDITLHWGSKGVLFNKELTPEVMCSWRFQKIEYNGEINWSPIRPVVRISPKFYLGVQDNVWRFVCKKMVTEMLPHGFQFYTRNRYFCYSVTKGSYCPQVIIDECPFTLQKVDNPSASTSDSKLVDTILKYQSDLCCNQLL